jgi:antitoxin CptB
MSGPTRSSADLDDRRRRLLYRAWHRGMREMDLIMGAFCEAEIGTLSDGDLAVFEALIEVPDPTLYGWINDPASIPPEVRTPLLDRLTRSRAHQPTRTP